jgi:hypothetical protein
MYSYVLGLFSLIFDTSCSRALGIKHLRIIAGPVGLTLADGIGSDQVHLSGSAVCHHMMTDSSGKRADLALYAAVQ